MYASHEQAVWACARVTLFQVPITRAVARITGVTLVTQLHIPHV
jgi:hypothetical protein